MSRPSIKNKRIQNGSIFYLMENSDSEQWVDFQLMSDHLDQVIQFQKQLQANGGIIQQLEKTTKEKKTKNKKRRGKKRGSTKSKIDSIKKEQSSAPTNITSNTLESVLDKDKQQKKQKLDEITQHQNNSQKIVTSERRTIQFLEQQLLPFQNLKIYTPKMIQQVNQHIQSQDINTKNEQRAQQQKTITLKEKQISFSQNKKYHQTAFKQEIVELIYIGRNQQGKSIFEVLRQDGYKQVLTNYQIRKQNPYILLDFYEKYVEQTS